VAATTDDWATEFLGLVLAVCAVDSLDEAMEYIVQYNQHLRDLGEHAPLKVSASLDEQDWRVCESRYAASGCAPYAPRRVMGLISA